MAKQCRAVAAQCLAEISAGRSLNHCIDDYEQQLPDKDRGLYRELCYGSLRLFPKLEGIANQLLKKPLKKKDADIKMLIIIGLYQLTETRIPDHAAIDSIVKAAIAMKKPWAKGLVNAVLRNWQRSSEQLLEQLKPSQSHAFPEWLYKRLQQSWPMQLEQICTASNSHPPMCLRVNQLKVSRDDYLEQLENSNITAHCCDHAEQGVRLSKPVGVFSLPGFEDGLVSVQDESAQLCARLLELKENHRVLDACAAPGGKTCHILEEQPKLDSLIALEISEQRLVKIQENLDRLSLMAQLVSADATDLASWWDQQAFDRILLDAPCSATGVIRRNPDIKIHRTPKDIEQLNSLQLSLLKQLWSTLAPGGLMLYATCSILPEENTQLVEHFCQTTEDASHQPIDASWGIEQHYGRQLLPEQGSHDGFYYALIRKNN